MTRQTHANCSEEKRVVRVGGRGRSSYAAVVRRLTPRCDACTPVLRMAFEAKGRPQSILLGLRRI
jgi:hypothetical protein